MAERPIPAPVAVHPALRVTQSSPYLPRRLALLLIVLLTAFALRTLYLDYNDVEGDEAFSYTFSVDSLQGIINTTLTIAEPHPIGSYFFNHFWLQMAGDSAFSFRFPSAWFGVLAAALTYRLGRRLRLTAGSNRDFIPIIGAVLVTLSPFLVAESRNARMYSMSVALTLASTWLALELLRCPAGHSSGGRSRWRNLLSAAFTPRSVRLLLAYCLVSWLALNVHYFTGTILVAQNVFVLALLLAVPLRKQWHRLLRWVVAEIIILLAFAPWYLQVRTILSTYPGLSYYSPALDFMVKLMSGVFMIGQYAPNWNAVYSVAGLITVLAGLVRLVLSGRGQRWGALLLVPYLVIPFAMAYLDSRGRSTFAERQVIATAPAFYLLVAAATVPVLQTARDWYRRSVGIAPALVFGVIAFSGIGVGLRGYYLVQRSQPSSWQTFIRYVERYSANVTPAQLRVGQNYPEPAIAFYYKGTPRGFTLPVRANDLDGAIKVAQEFADTGVERVILREDAWSWWNGGKLSDIAQTALSTQFTKMHQFFTGRWWVFVYGRMSLSDLTPFDISFSNGLVLTAAATRPLTALRTDIPGKVLEVYLRWQSESAKLTSSEKLFIHVLDRNGQVPSQLDVPLTTQDTAIPVKAYGVPLADDLPAGTYQIRVGIYDPSLPGSPRLRTSDNNDGIQIGTLTIEQ